MLCLGSWSSEHPGCCHTSRAHTRQRSLFASKIAWGGRASLAANELRKMPSDSALQEVHKIIMEHSHRGTGFLTKEGRHSHTTFLRGSQHPASHLPVTAAYVDIFTGEEETGSIKE